MLRVYSILYIEKLWKPSPTPLLRQVPSTRSSLQTTSVPYIEQEEVVEEEEAFESRQIVVQPEQELEVEYEEQPDDIVNDFGVMTVEVIPEEETNQIQEQEQEQESEAEESRLDNRRDSKVSVDVSQVMADDVVESLTIDTQQKKSEIKKDSHIAVDELFEEPAAIATSLSSASSSLAPPATPDSIHSNTNNEKSPNISPRTTSLIRRETNKLNDRRKSLTKKLKKALSAKTSGTTNKRNSV